MVEKPIKQAFQQKIGNLIDICTLREGKFLLGWEFKKFPWDRKLSKLRKFPNLVNFPGIPVWEIPGR